MNEKYLAAIRRDALLPVRFSISSHEMVGMLWQRYVTRLACMCWIGRSMKILLVSLKVFVVMELFFYPL